MIVTAKTATDWIMHRARELQMWIGPPEGIRPESIQSAILEYLDHLTEQQLRLAKVPGVDVPPAPSPSIWVILRDGVVQGSYRERPNDEICSKWVSEGMVVERWSRPAAVERWEG